MGLSKGKINIQKLNRRLEHMKYLDVLQIIILKWSEGMDMIYLAKQKEN
jgi:ABC-type amino acid transport substrate-binding protein